MLYLLHLTILLTITAIKSIDCGAPLVAPYVDIFHTLLPDQPSLKEMAEMTGLRGLTVAFVLAKSRSECTPMWGGRDPLDYDEYINEIRAFQAIGGQVIVATGGAMAPYLEMACKSVTELAAAYELILDTVKTDHLDIDVEAAFDFDQMNEALAMIQKKRPSFTVSFTLITQGPESGITDSLGTAVLRNAIKHGVKVEIVNPMAMEFDTSKSFGEAVIDVGRNTIEQLRKIWPEKSTAELSKMLGITPMIGKNNNGKIFSQENARQLVKWANDNGIGRLAFWSVGRDNGRCPGGWVDWICSSISQELFEFSKIFATFGGNTGPIIDSTTTTTTTQPITTVSTTTTSSTTTTTTSTTTTPTPSTTTQSTTTTPLTTLTITQTIPQITTLPTTQSSTSTTISGQVITGTTTTTSSIIDCRHTDKQFFAHETDCHKYYHCTTEAAVIETCPSDTIWDIDLNICNWIGEVKNRPQCTAQINCEKNPSECSQTQSTTSAPTSASTATTVKQTITPSVTQATPSPTTPKTIATQPTPVVSTVINVDDSDHLIQCLHNGYISHPTDPHKYILCEYSAGKWWVHIMDCAPGTRWHETLLDCIFDD